VASLTLALSWALCSGTVANAADRGVKVIGAHSYADRGDVAVTVEIATAPKTLCGVSVQLTVRGTDVSRRLPSLRTSVKGDGLWEWRINGRIPAAQWMVTVSCHVAARATSALRSFSAPAGAGRGTETGIFVPGSVKATPITIKGESGGDGGGAKGLYPRGQCTWFVAMLRPDLPYFPGHSGDAANWLASAKKDGLPTGTVPAKGAVAVFRPHQDGADRHGHVAYVKEVLDGTALIKIAESNFLYHLRPDEQTISSRGLHFIYEKGGVPAGGGAGENKVGGEAAQAPVNTSAPAITGTPQVGRELTCTNGSWSGTPMIVYAYQWLRDGAALPLAVTSAYTVESIDEGHLLSCLVTATNGAGSTVAPTAAVTVLALPTNTLAPTVEGVPKAASVVTCAKGAWAGSPIERYGYEWLLNAAPIPGATDAQYAVRAEDEGSSLSCKVTAVNAAGETTAASRPVTIHAKPVDIDPPRITGGVKAGEARVGDALSCDPGTWTATPSPSFEYRWLRGASQIAAATSEGYEVQPADEGHALVCEVRAANDAGSAALTSTPVQVATLPENMSPPQVLGSAKVASTLECAHGSWEGSPAPSFSYQWRRNGLAVAMATEATYAIQAADEGRTLSCEVTATNTAGSQTAPSSNGVAVPEEARIQREEEERKEKEVIVSVDDTKGDRAPYDAEFNVAWQKFTAASDTITYAGVTIANPQLPVGASEYTLELRLCTTEECTGAGAQLGHAMVMVNNYGSSAGNFEHEIDVTPGATYYLVWGAPADVEGAKWLAYWHGGLPTPVEKSEEMEAVVRGYDRGGASVDKREIISFAGGRPPPAPYAGPFKYVYQGFIAASNRITTLGVVIGNPAVALHKPAVPQEVEVLLCESRTCEGAPLAQGKASIVNYGLTEVKLAKAVTMILNREYFVYWRSPAEYQATPWLAFWRGSGPKPEDAEALQVVVKGYDAGSMTPQPTYFTEVPEVATSTFKNYENASAPGPGISEGHAVTISCKVFAPEISSSEPEGYWYRIHSAPWNDEYYAVTNAFQNNHEGRHDVNTDFNVPDC
jgi:surface antigen